MTLMPVRTLGMELKVMGNQLILSGRAVGDEPDNVREAFANSPEIDTVVLRNSPGGDAPAGYRVGQMCESAPNQDPAPARVITLIRCHGIQ
jgi:hypothetical protein